MAGFPGTLARSTGRWLTGLTLAVVVAGCAEPGMPGGTLYVASGFTDQVFVLDASTGEVIDSVWLDRRPGERDEPHGVAASADGRHWYATVAHGEPTLWKFETQGQRLVGRLTLPLRGAGRVRLSPDGEFAVVPDYWRGVGGPSGEVALIRTLDLTLVAVSEVCEGPHDAAFDPAGDRVAITCSRGTEVVVAGARTLAVEARYTLDESQGARPMNAAWSADGNALFVSLMGRNAVARVDLLADSISRLEVGNEPAQVSTAGGALVVAERGSRSATVLDPATSSGHLITSPGAHPHGVATSPDGRVAYVTYEGDVNSEGGVWALDVATGAVLWERVVGVYTLGIAYSPASAAEASVSASPVASGRSSSSSSDAELMQ